MRKKNGCEEELLCGEEDLLGREEEKGPRGRTSTADEEERVVNEASILMRTNQLMAMKISIKQSSCRGKSGRRRHGVAAPVSLVFGHFITPLVVADDAAYDDHEQG